MIKAVKILKEHGVLEENIIVLNLFCTPHGKSMFLKLRDRFSTTWQYRVYRLLRTPCFSFVAARCVISTFPEMTILTSEIHPVAPNHFGQKYFGTD